MLYAVTGIVHWITGLNVITIMPKIAPIFGGLSILIFYFIVYELIGNKKIALLSSLILTVLPFHAYQTSHASPLTMGHFFLMLSMYLFIRYRKDIRYIIPLLISTLLLIMSHHFTTYIYLISLFFIIFIENASMKEWTSHIKLDILYFFIASGSIFTYWAFIAKPVYENFMSSGLKIGNFQIESLLTIIIFYLLFLLSFSIIWAKRKLNFYSYKKDTNAKSSLLKFFIALIIFFSIMCLFMFIKLPWTNFSFTPLSIFYSLPLLIIFAFGVAGFRKTRFIKNGFFIRGWLIGLLLSFIYGILTNNWTLYPHRHLEYIMIPLSIISIYGIRNIFLNIHHEDILKLSRKLPDISSNIFDYHRKIRLMRKRQIIYLVAIIFIVTTNAVSIYPSHQALNESFEAITNEDLSVIDWMKENIDNSSTIIATDHRLARLAESAGFNTTLDETILLWEAVNLSGYVKEIFGINKNHSRITHVIIDNIMMERVVHVGFGRSVYMTNESYEKFLFEPFELIYKNTTLNLNLEEEYWTEIYKINWPYIQNDIINRISPFNNNILIKRLIK
jgi:hypothetical protein